MLPRRPRSVTTWNYAPDHTATNLARAALLGQFNLGSTVVALFPPGAVRWRNGLTAGTSVRMGMALGDLDGTRAPT